MKSESDKHDIVRSVMELRDAAEAHGRALEATKYYNGPDARLEVLDARITLEESIARAIEACSTCGRPHCDEHERDAPG